MSKKLAAVFTVLAMVLSVCGAFLPAAAFAADMPVYQASEAFVESSDGNPAGQWEWGYYQKTADGGAESWTYHKMDRYKTTGDQLNGTAFPIPGGTTADLEAVYGFGMHAYNNSPVVTRYWMQTSANSSGELDNKTLRTVRVFTVPETGNITISAEDFNGDSRLWGAQSGSYTYGPGARVVLVSGGVESQIWPASGWQTVPQAEGVSVDFAPLILNVWQGDVLRFELSTETLGSSQVWRYQAYWDPVVAYNAYEHLKQEEQTVYQASDSYVESSGGNPSGQWQWEYYNVPTQQYIAMDRYKAAKPFPSSDDYPVPEGEATVSSFGMHNNDNTPSVGKYWMQASADTTESSSAYYKNVYAVRTFTVPEQGNYTISAEDAYGESTIMGIQSASSYGPNTRIMLERNGENTQIWPASGWQMVAGNARVAFAPLYVNLYAGDKLHFEVTTEHLSGGNYWRHSVYWDPVILYNTEAFITGVEPGSLENLATDQVFSLTFDSEMEEVTEQHISISGGSTAPSIRDFSFTGTSISFAFDGLEYGADYEVSIHNLCRSGSDRAYFTYRFAFRTFSLESYLASDYYIEASGGNPSGPWQWNRYEIASGQYIALTNFKPTQPFVDAGDITPAGETSVSGFSLNANNNSNTVGKYWMQSYADINQCGLNYTVRSFTAPMTGLVTISAEDVNGESNIMGMRSESTAGPNVRIMLEHAGESRQIWPANGEWQLVEGGMDVYFEPMEVELEEGDRLHFELSTAHFTNSGQVWRYKAYWNPRVTYEEAYPRIVEQYPADGAEAVHVNETFRITFDQPIRTVSEENVVIDNGAAVKNIWIENDTVLCIEFDGLTEYTTYSLGLRNIRLQSMGVDNNYRRDFTFTTAAYVLYGDITANGGTALRSGPNTFRLQVNNTRGSAHPARVTVIAAVCAGTPEDYTIETVAYETREIVDDEEITLTVAIPEVSGRFVKAVAVDDVSFGKALTSMFVLGGA